MKSISSSCNRRAFLKGIGLAAGAAPFMTSGLLAQSPNTIVRHASFGAAGQAGSDIAELTKFKEVQFVAVAEVDLKRAEQLKTKFPELKIYQDWRKLLEEQGSNLDSINVSTPDHMHAAIAMTGLAAGKHVYCQKPLAHDLYEVRKLTEYAHARPLVTQMGIQIHSVNHYRLASILIKDGVIGKIKEVHSWCPKSWGDEAPMPAVTDEVPEGLDWDAWLGVCSTRPFIGKAYYHPANWRKRLDFGTGTFGDMGCHIFDPVFDALELAAPMTVRSEGAPPNATNWALNSHIVYQFAGTRFTADPHLTVHWYDGNQAPVKGVLDLLEGDERPNTGSIFVGTKGVLVLPHISRPLLYPDKQFKDFKFPGVLSGDHYGEFIQAVRGQCKTSAPFSYAGPLTEAVLLGGIASRFPKTTLTWNSAALKFNENEANKFVRREYRPGWAPKELSA